MPHAASAELGGYVGGQVHRHARGAALGVGDGLAGLALGGGHTAKAPPLSGAGRVGVGWRLPRDDEEALGAAIASATHDSATQKTSGLDRG